MCVSAMRDARLKGAPRTVVVQRGRNILAQGLDLLDLAGEELGEALL